MRRESGSFTWGIRWETVERLSGVPLYGARLPDTFQTRRQARWRQRWLAAQQPLQPNPRGGMDRRRVRYLMFARPDGLVHGG
ncbi:MAG TPA: hypothetical protein VIG08_16915 [Gemmatimonadales bacterium]|jgi:hypothetical protein